MGMRRRPLSRRDESKDLRCAEGDAVGEAKRLNRIILGQEIVRNNQLILGGKAHLKVNTLATSRQKVRGSQIGEGHSVLVDAIGFIVSDGFDGTTPDNHIGVISLTTDKRVTTGTGDQTVASAPSMKCIMTSSTIKDVITITPMKSVVAIPSCQSIVQDTPMKKIVAVKTVDSVRHVIEATKRVIACCCTSYHDAVAKMAILPDISVGELESLHSVSLRREMMLHPQTVRTSIVQVQL